MLVGNKVDLGNKRQVCADEALAKAQQCNIEFIQSSAKFNINVKEVFMTLVLKTFQETSIEELPSKRSFRKHREDQTRNGDNKNGNRSLSPRDFSASIKRKSNGRTKLNSEGDSGDEDVDARCVLM